MKSNDKFPILQVWPYTLNGPSKLPQTTNQPHERDGISFILFSHWNCKKLRPQSFLKPAHWKGTMIPPVLETKQLHPKDRLTVSRTFWTIPGVRSVGNSGRQLRSVFPRFRASIWRSCGQNACRDLLNQSAGSYWTTDATYCTGYVGAAKNIMLIIFIFTWFPRQVSILIFPHVFHDFHASGCEFRVFTFTAWLFMIFTRLQDVIFTFSPTLFTLFTVQDVNFHSFWCFFVIFVPPSANGHAFTIAGVDFGGFSRLQMLIFRFFAFSHSRVWNFTFFVIFTLPGVEFRRVFTFSQGQIHFRGQIPFLRPNDSNGLRPCFSSPNAPQVSVLRPLS